MGSASPSYLRRQRARLVAVRQAFIQSSTLKGILALYELPSVHGDDYEDELLHSSMLPPEPTADVGVLIECAQQEAWTRQTMRALMPSCHWLVKEPEANEVLDVASLHDGAAAVVQPHGMGLSGRDCPAVVNQQSKTQHEDIKDDNLAKLVGSVDSLGSSTGDRTHGLEQDVSGQSVEENLADEGHFSDSESSPDTGCNVRLRDCPHPPAGIGVDDWETLFMELSSTTGCHELVVSAMRLVTTRVEVPRDRHARHCFLGGLRQILETSIMEELKSSPSHD